MPKKTEFQIVKEVTDKLGLENKTDGSIVRYNKKYHHRKPDGLYEYKDIVIVLDAKAEGEKFIGQLEDYLPAEKEKQPKKHVFGIKYNGKHHYAYLNEITNLLPDAKVLADKEYYYNLAHNFELDKTEIYKMSREINHILHNMGLASLLDRMVWTVCVLVACRNQTLYNTEPSYKMDVVRLLKQAITNDLNKNSKLEILIEEFESINIDHNKEKLKRLLSIINDLSDLLNSKKWNGEDVGAIFFNEFTRYKGKAQDGQVFTPENWTSFMYKLISCNSQDKILDAACGSAGFLVKAMNLMTEEEPHSRERIHSKQLFGVENSRKIYAVACANMLLHKDGKSNIIQGDSTNENKLTGVTECENVGEWIKKKRITKVLMNPPFEGSTGIKILSNVLDNVQPNADVAFILPNRTLLTKSKTIVRRILNKHTLLNIIAMPEATWRGLANVNTSIFVFKAHIPQLDKPIVKYYIEEDGLVTVKNSGRHDTKKVWQNKLENFWLDIIKNNKQHPTKQEGKQLEYVFPKKIIPLKESDFDKTILDRILFENPEIKEKVDEIKEKVDEIKEKDWLLWSIKSSDDKKE